MSDAYIVRRSGSAGLNFTISGSMSRPQPKDNLIWIKTSKKISDWAMSPDPPDNVKDGCIWIKTIYPGTVQINVIKKNSIIIGLNKASMYTSGTWNLVEASIYNGSWINFSNSLDYIYNKGEQVVPWMEYFYDKFYDRGVCKFDRTQIDLSVITDSSKSRKFVAVRTTDTVDLIKYKTIYADVSYTTNSSTGSYAFFYLTNGNTINDDIIFTISQGSHNIVKLDLSYVRGSHNVAFRILADQPGINGKLTIHRVWGDPV